MPLTRPIWKRKYWSFSFNNLLSTFKINAAPRALMPSVIQLEGHLLTAHSLSVWMVYPSPAPVTPRLSCFIHGTYPFCNGLVSLAGHLPILYFPPPKNKYQESRTLPPSYSFCILSAWHVLWTQHVFAVWASVWRNEGFNRETPAESGLWYPASSDCFQKPHFLEYSSRQVKPFLWVKTKEHLSLQEMEAFRKTQTHQAVNKTKFAEPSKGNSECIHYLSVPWRTKDAQKLPENRYLLAWPCFIFPFSCSSFTAVLNIFLISSDISCQVFPFSALADGCIYGNVQVRHLSLNHQRKTDI